MNEILFFTSIFLDLLFILFALRFGKAGVIGLIVVNIILVSTFGSKLILLFGFETNAGNVFYASIFLASNILNEHFGKRVSFQAVWIGFMGLVLFVIMGQFVIAYISAHETSSISAAMEMLFTNVPRVAFASMFAYIVAQNVNIITFDFLHQKEGSRLLWFRNVASQGVSQLIDSLLFFPIAFFGTTTILLLIQATLIGFIAKLIVACISTPIVYFSYLLKDDASV